MELRKLYTAIEETFGEMGRVADEPLRKVAAIAVVKNPFAGKGYIEDLGDLTEASEEVVMPLSPERYPSLMRFTMEHVMQPGYDFGASFEAGLDYVLDGVERAGAAAAEHRA